MRFGKYILLLLIPAFILSGHSSYASLKNKNRLENSIGGHDIHKKKKKKKKKPAKKKKNKSKTSRLVNDRQDTAKLNKQKKKRDKKHDKNLDKVQKDRQKKADALTKSQDKNRKDYSGCDSADVVRTSKDTALLVKYEKIYHSLGGLCYIIHLEQMGDPLKTSDGFYTVEIKKSSDPRAPADWQTYLYCPIGKADGFYALVSPEGDTVQTCAYAGEKKTGLMSWMKKGEGVIHQERYVNDVAVWVSDEQQQ